MSNSKPSLSLVSLGGLHEIGKNMWICEAGGVEPEYLILDAGIYYPGYDAPGVDYKLPDYKYLLNKIDKIQALVVSSFHESHHGGAHHIIQKCNIKKVVGSKLALEAIKLKLSDEYIKNIEWVSLETRKTIELGRFKVLPFRITSNSTEAFSLIVEANGSRVFYTGTYKIDQTPCDGIKSDIAGLGGFAAACYENGSPIDLMISNSVGIELDGYSKSEFELRANLRKFIQSKKSRVIINTYNSNTIRIQNIFSIAEELGRKVALLNKDARETYEAAKRSGVITHNAETLISIKDINNYKDSELIIIATAPENEALKELENIGFDRSLEIQVKEGDVVINSGDLPPGTVRIMAQISDQFFLKGVEIIGGKASGLHVESHALPEEMKFLFNLIRPKYFIPDMGETRHLVRHARLAVDTGFDPGSILIISNGDKIEISNGNLEVTGVTDVGDILFSNAQDFQVDTKILKERDALAKEGIVIVSFSINKKKKVVSGPVFSAKACTFSNNKEWRAFCLMNSQEVVDAIERLGDENPQANIDDYQTLVREHMNRIIRTVIGKRPAVIVLANEV